MRLKFQCEVCRVVYDTEREAQVCESSPPPDECPIRAGDRVRFTDDNRNECEDTVLRVYLGASHLTGAMKSWDGDVDGFLARVGASGRPPRFHAWHVQLAHEWKWGDEAYSDTVAASVLTVPPAIPA